MKQGKAIIARAARIRAAVTAAVTGKGCPCPGARIEELLGDEIAQYPDQIMSLDVLPSLTDWKFIGYTADFDQVEVTQFSEGVNSATEPLVGWKPIRLGDAPLTGSIAEIIQGHHVEPEVATCYQHEPYKGIPFCDGKHGRDWCKDPFCYRRK